MARLGFATLGWIDAGGHLAGGPRASEAAAPVAVEPAVAAGLAATAQHVDAELRADTTSPEPPSNPAPDPPATPASPGPATPSVARVAVETAAAPSLTPRPSLDPDAVARLFGRGAPTPAAPPVRLRAILKHLGRPEVVADAAGWEQQRAALTEATRLLWDLDMAVDIEGRRALVSLIAARVRYFIAHATGDLNGLFSSLTKYSKERQPGFVVGLSRNQTPRMATWLEDAEDAWAYLKERTPEASVEPNPERALAALTAALEASQEPSALSTLVRHVLESGIASADPRLTRRLAPYLDLIAPDLKAVRKAVRKHLAETEAPPGSPPDVVPADWPFLDRTRGRDAILVGGDRREQAQDRVKAAFGFNSVYWDSGWEPRRVEALAERVTRGGIDVVILLARFLSHKTWDAIVPACKSANVPFAVVERGYGVASIQATLEHVYSGRGRATDR